MLHSPSHILSAQERTQISELVAQGIPDELRGLYWQKCAGLDAFKSSYCANYYSTINQAQATGLWQEYPNPHFGQIDKDLDRTFPLDKFYTDEIKQSMRRVFRAYVWRNPAVGYI